MKGKPPNKYFFHNGTQYILTGNERLAMSHFHEVRTHLGLLKMTNVHGLPIVFGTKEFDDGTVAKFQLIHGRERINVFAPSYVSEDKIIELVLEEEEEIIVPVIRAKDGTGFVACMSGTFEGPYQWFPNDHDLPHEVFYDKGAWGYDPSFAIKDLKSISNNDNMELFFLRPGSVQPTDEVDDWPEDIGSVGGGYYAVGGSFTHPTWSSEFSYWFDDQWNLGHLWQAVVIWSGTWVADEPTFHTQNYAVWGQSIDLLSYSQSNVFSGVEHRGYGAYDMPGAAYWCDGSPTGYTGEDMVNDALMEAYVVHKAECDKDPAKPTSAQWGGLFAWQKDRYRETITRWADLLGWEECFRAVQGNASELAVAYELVNEHDLWENHYAYDLGYPSGQFTPDTHNDYITSNVHTREFIFQVDGTKHVISEWTEVSYPWTGGTINYYYLQDDGIKYYTRNDRSGVVGLLAVEENRYDDLKWIYKYIHVRGGADNTPTITDFSYDIEEGYNFAHKIENIQGINQDDFPNLYFDQQIFLGLIHKKS